jgi:hypothetical protein
MQRRAAPILAALLPLLAACGGRAPPPLSAEAAYARLPEEIGGFRKSRPEEGQARTIIARYAHPNRSAALIHALPPTSRGNAQDGEEALEVGAAVEVFARALVNKATARQENVTLRHFGARLAEPGPAARCLDAHLRSEEPRRQLGCAAMLERRVYFVMMVAPESVDARRGLRDPLLAVTMRLIGALSGQPPEPVPASADEVLPPPPEAAPPAPKRPAPPRPTRPGSGPTWRT